MAKTKLKDFITSFKKDIARPYLFDVDIVIPYLLLPFKDTSRLLSFRCESASLPGRTFETVERRIGSVPIERLPNLTTYNEMQMTFIVSDDMQEKLFFDLWMEIINPNSDYNFKYKNDYVADIAINQYNLTNPNEASYRPILWQAFPVSLNQMDLGWDSEGVHKLEVTFAYSYWSVGTLDDLTKNLYTTGLSGLDKWLQGKGTAST